MTKNVRWLALLALPVLAACGDDTGGNGGNGGNGGGGTGGAAGTTSTSTSGPTSTTSSSAAQSTSATTGAVASSSSGGEGGDTGAGGNPGTGGGTGTGGAEDLGPYCGDRLPAPEDTPSAGECVDIDFNCNPVTNFPCDTDAGEQCDFSGDGFDCYEGSTVPLCGECDGDAAFCLGGSTCTLYAYDPEIVANGCAKYCCDDDDCGDGGTCAPAIDIPGASVGLCLNGPIP